MIDRITNSNLPPTTEKREVDTKGASTGSTQGMNLISNSGLGTASVFKDNEEMPSNASKGSDTNTDKQGMRLQ